MQWVAKIAFASSIHTSYMRLGSLAVEAVYRKSSAKLNLNRVSQLIFVMVKCGVLFEVRTEFLNNI
jgi:hypothetical protein